MVWLWNDPPKALHAKDLVSAYSAIYKRLDQGGPNLMLSSWLTVLSGVGPQLQQSGPRGYNTEGIAFTLHISAFSPSVFWLTWASCFALLCLYHDAWPHWDAYPKCFSRFISRHSDGRLRQVPFIGLCSTCSVCFPRHCSSFCFFPLLWYVVFNL